MEINFNQALKDFDGESLAEMNPKTNAVEAITLRAVCINSLMGQRSDLPVENSESMKRYLIAKKIASGAMLTLDEVAKIKECIGVYMTHPLVRCISQDMLDEALKS